MIMDEKGDLNSPTILQVTSPNGFLGGKTHTKQAKPYYLSGPKNSNPSVLSQKQY